MNFSMDHVALYVQNLQASIDFYTRLSFEVTDRVYFNHRHIAMLSQRQKPDQQIEWIQPDQDSSHPYTDHFHLAFLTSDLNAALAFLLQDKQINEWPDIHTGFNGSRFVFICGPDRETIQLVEAANLKV